MPATVPDWKLALVLGHALSPAALLLAPPASAQGCQLGNVYRQVVEGGGQIRDRLETTNSETTNSETATRAIAAAVPVQIDTTVDGDRLDRTIDRVCDAAKGLGVQPGITVLGVAGMTGTIMGRLDAGRRMAAPTPSGGAGSDGMMGLGMMALGMGEQASQAPQAGPSSPFTVFAGGTLLGGDGRDTPAIAGFTYAAGSGLLGLEYSASRNLILGAAASFTRMDADLTTGASTDAEALHGAAYLSYATRVWFVDALAAYGVTDLDMTRPGAVGPVHGSTEANALGLAVRGGYLFELGKVRVGPIAGLTYVGARVGGYAETGGDPTAVVADGVSIESLTSSAGLRLLAPFQAGGTLLVPYLNVTWEHQLGDNAASLTANLVQAPGTPVSLSFPVYSARDYGKVEGGVTLELAPESSISLSGASTFARDDGQDFRFNAGLNYRF